MKMIGLFIFTILGFISNGVNGQFDIPGCLDAFNQAALFAHNQYRAAHGAPALSLDTNIVNTAQNYANKLANANSGLVHSTGSGYGENLAMSMGRPLSTVDDCASFGRYFTKMWYDEVSYYSYNNPGFTMQTGHFTQLVWKSTTKVGFGLSKSGSSIYCVANYSPPGNYMGDFPNNVLPSTNQGVIQVQQNVAQTTTTTRPTTTTPSKLQQLLFPNQNNPIFKWIPKSKLLAALMGSDEDANVKLSMVL